MVANQATNVSALSQNVAPKRHLREGLSNCPWTKICEPWQGCHPPQATFVSPSVPCSSTVWARKKCCATNMQTPKTETLARLDLQHGPKDVTCKLTGGEDDLFCKPVFLLQTSSNKLCNLAVSLPISWIWLFPKSPVVWNGLVWCLDIIKNLFWTMVSPK